MRLMMPTEGYALFPTAIGHCAVAWGAHGLTGVQLPEADEAATRARMARRFAHWREAPAPPPVQSVAPAQPVAVPPAATPAPGGRLIDNMEALDQLATARWQAGDWWGSRGPSKEAKALRKQHGR